MKVLVTGVNGQLGYDVIKELVKRKHQGIAVTRREMDLSTTSQIYKCINTALPDAIVHCAAYTSVDLAEENEFLARSINSLATKDIALCAHTLNIPLIYISTDYVFDGRKGIENLDENEYIENYGIEKLTQNYIPYDEDDTPNPINIYGKTKLEGENFVREILDKYYIVRTSWVFGQNGDNFISKMLNISKYKNELNIVHDQIGSPTYTKDLAKVLVDMVETDKYGVYHFTNEGYCSWYELAKEIFALTNIDIKLNKVCTSMYNTKATRPLNSMMSKEKLIKNGFSNSRTWKESVLDYLK